VAEDRLHCGEIVCLQEIAAEGAPEVVPGEMLDLSLGDSFVEYPAEGFAGQA